MKAGVAIEPVVLERAGRPDRRGQDEVRRRAFLQEHGL